MSATSLDPRSSEAYKGCPAELVDWPDGQNSSATAFGLRCAEQMNSWAGLAVEKSEATTKNWSGGREMRVKIRLLVFPYSVCDKRTQNGGSIHNSKLTVD